MREVLAAMHRHPSPGHSRQLLDAGSADRRKRAEFNRTPPIEVEHILEMVAAIPDARWRLAFQLVAADGLRPEELRHLERRDDHPNISVLAKRPAACRQGCQLDVLVQLNTPAPIAAAQRQPVAIAIVIDRSGSMAGPRLQAACAAAQQLLRQLTPSDRVAVISFDNAVDTVVPLGAPSEESIARIGSIRPGGSTALVGQACYDCRCRPAGARPVLEQAAWEALPLDEQVSEEVLLQQAARRRREAMQGIDRGDAGLSRASVQQEEQRLGELLKLISSDQLALARKVMGTQAFLRARGRKLCDQEGQEDA
jgi:hypothetical protein